MFIVKQCPNFNPSGKARKIQHVRRHHYFYFLNVQRKNESKQKCYNKGIWKVKVVWWKSILPQGGINIDGILIFKIISFLMAIVVLHYCTCGFVLHLFVFLFDHFVLGCNHFSLFCLNHHSTISYSSSPYSFPSFLVCLLSPFLHPSFFFLLNY